MSGQLRQSVAAAPLQVEQVESQDVHVPVTGYLNSLLAHLHFPEVPSFGRVSVQVKQSNSVTSLHVTQLLSHVRAHMTFIAATWYCPLLRSKLTTGLLWLTVSRLKDSDVVMLAYSSSSRY